MWGSVALFEGVSSEWQPGNPKGGFKGDGDGWGWGEGEVTVVECPMNLLASEKL